jgi:hypothetical protein
MQYAAKCSKQASKASKQQPAAACHALSNMAVAGDWPFLSLQITTPTPQAQASGHNWELSQHTLDMLMHWHVLHAPR